MVDWHFNKPTIIQRSRSRLFYVCAECKVGLKLQSSLDASSLINFLFNSSALLSFVLRNCAVEKF